MIQGDALGRAPARPALRTVPIRLRPGMSGGYVVMLLLALLYAIPMVFVLFVALESPRQFATNAASIPDPVMWSNVPNAWTRGEFSSYFVNTVTYTLVITIGTLVIATLAAFPIARGHVRGSNGFYLLFVSGLLLPAGLIPQFFVMHQLGLFDTRIGYILLWISRMAFPVFVLAGFVKGIPSELDDAAAIDGCGYVRYVFQVVMPLLKPALGVVGLIVTIRVWNDVVNPVIFLPSRAIKPISAGLFQFYAENTAELTLIAAAIVITASPLILLFLFTQRYIVAGLTGGALKG
ncbi:MAG TPA: carbohydrate ABC transporter permease [Chloroflexota bacterium]|nr:carbohydrate ABC transporter permease [Chloroflexota bacterium]